METPERQAITYKTFNPNSIMFSKVKKVKNGYILFKRIYVTYKYPNGERDKIRIETTKLISCGVQLNYKKQMFSMNISTASWQVPDDTEHVDSYVLPLVNSMVGSTEEESNTIELFETLFSLFKNHLRDPGVKEELER